jgi:hypothetical protein
MRRGRTLFFTMTTLKVWRVRPSPKSNSGFEPESTREEAAFGGVVSVLKPKTIDVNITGVHTLTLECFSPGMTSEAGGWNVAVAWGNARISEGH